MALFSSSTRTIPASVNVPQHIAIIMDGNGRWAKQRFCPEWRGTSAVWKLCAKW